MYKLFQGSSQVRKRFMLHDNVDDLVILIYCVLIPKSSTPHEYIVVVHILRYVHSYIYLIRLFSKVPRGQAVVEPPFKVRLFPSLKIANARMEKSIYMVPCKVPCYTYNQDLKQQALVGKFFKFDLGDSVVCCSSRAI